MRYHCNSIQIVILGRESIALHLGCECDLVAIPPLLGKFKSGHGEPVGCLLRFQLALLERQRALLVLRAHTDIV